MKLNALLSAVFSLAILTHYTPAARAADAAKAEDNKPETKKEEATPAAKPFVLPDPVAVVEGTEIKKSELEETFGKAAAQAGKNPSEISDEQKQQAYRSILNDLIIEKLLAKRSEKEAITDEQVDKQLQQIKKQFPSEDKLKEELAKNGLTLDKLQDEIRSKLKIEHWIESQIAGKDTVTDADVQAFYDQHPEYFKMPEMVRASHILIATPEGAKPEQLAEKEKKAKEIAEQMKKGGDFEKTAKEVSEDPGSKEKGGDLDFFAHDRMVPEFADAAFKMKKGDISDPVKSQFGFHIIKVTDKKEARTIPLAEAKEKITTFLKDSKRKTAAGELIAAMREKADVKVNLPPVEKAPEKTAEKKKAE